MEKAILSRINLQRQDTHIAQEYFDTISDLIDTQEVQALKKCSQHMATSRFQHSLNVSYSPSICLIYHALFRVVIGL